MTIKALAIAAAICLPTALHAQGTVKPIDYQARYDKCVKDAGGARNATVGTCVDAAGDEAGKEIAHRYDQSRTTLTKHDKNNAASFAGAHEAWSSYRDAQCKLAGVYVGSPMYHLCPMQSKIARVKELREFREFSQSFER